MDLAQRWPDVLWIARHGESAGNVAGAEAEASGARVVAVATRDVDVPLSDLGARQAEALGHWFATLRPDERPNVVMCSPYVRAQRTAEIALAAACLPVDSVDFVVDERLREREFGILDGLTRAGVWHKYPEQYELKQAIGKFYHRPPGGESWCDVVLRLRSVTDTIRRDHRRERVLVVCHAVVVLCLRYLLDGLTEEQILAIDASDAVANCSLTTYDYDPTLGASGRMVLREFNFTAPLETEGAPVTTQPDVPVAPK
jgi:probable phosphoglycerate mutase